MTSRWPWPGDGPTVRARKVAWAYRAALEDAGLKEQLTELDDRFVGWDETWIAPTRTFDPDDWITASQGGPLIGVAKGTLSNLRVRGRIKARRDGNRYLYQVRDIYALSDDVRGRPKTSTDRVPD